jgi:hypothetical protein
MTGFEVKVTGQVQLPYKRVRERRVLVGGRGGGGTEKKIGFYQGVRVYPSPKDKKLLLLGL